jgi:hypothetical protein
LPLLFETFWQRSAASISSSSSWLHEGPLAIGYNDNDDNGDNDDTCDFTSALFVCCTAT